MIREINNFDLCDNCNIDSNFLHAHGTPHYIGVLHMMLIYFTEYKTNFT